jgi:hypothetical protein
MQMYTYNISIILQITVSVAGHLCELQLHLKKFYEIKNDRGHKLYEWAREFTFAGINNPKQIVKFTPEALQGLERQLVQSCLKKPVEDFLSCDDWEYDALIAVFEWQSKKSEKDELFQIRSEFYDHKLPPKVVSEDEEPINKAFRLSGENKHEEAYAAYEEALTICRNTKR